MVSRTITVGVVPLWALATGAAAQTFNSFQLVDQLQGVTVEQTGPLEYRVSLSGAIPMLTMAGGSSPITNLVGFWALSEDDDIVGSTSDFGIWNANGNNSSTGAILGWKTNPNSGLVPGGFEIFTFDALNAAGVEFFGFRVRLDGPIPGGVGSVAYVYVPAPGGVVLLGLAGLLAARRKR